MIVKSDHEQIEKVWGTETIIVNTHKYCGKIMYLKKGFISSFHYHPEKEETFYCLSGMILVDVGEDGAFVLTPGMSIHLFPGERHSFKGMENSVFIEFSTHDDPKDSIRSTCSRKVEK